MSPRPPSPGMAVKIYLVFQVLNVFRPGQANRRLVAAKLTHAAAQAVVDQTPGTFIEKTLASK